MNARITDRTQARTGPAVNYPARGAWSDAEVTATVEDYLAMLAAELTGQPYSKAEHRRKLRPRLSASRTMGAIEFKYQNISAAMLDLGLPYIRGYKPMGNYQAALAIEVQRRLETNPGLLALLRADTGSRAPVDVGLERAPTTAMPAQARATPQGSATDNAGGRWEHKAGENVWMEITRRDDIGADLKAPAAARGGAVSASYALVPLVQPGDVVIHYDSRREAIVGVSMASSAAEPAPIYWVARGSYARRLGERPRWLPGLRVALDEYRELEPPLRLAEIRLHKDALLALREQLQARASGQPVYFPWIPYRDTLRTFQSYLVKMPQEAISLFPPLRVMVNQATAQPPGLVPASPVEQAEEAVQDAAGKAGRRGRGHGLQLDQKVNVAVEARAMNAATEFYSAWDWTVQDVHGTESYDLICHRGNEVKHVAVKGTTTDGAEVILTPNEVRHAQEYKNTALFVLSNIRVEQVDDGTVTATGGVPRLYDPWHLDDGILRPLGFRYQVPSGQSESNDGSR